MTGTPVGAGDAPPSEHRPSVAPRQGQLRTVFFGTPSFAVPALRRLARDDRFEVALVVTQPDRPAGRGRSLASPEIAEAAHQLGLPIYQPATLRDAAARAPLAEAAADLFVVAAFGLIFGPKTLALPRLGCVNLHASLLPRYRGASPVAAAIVSGEKRTGVTLMLMDAGLDTGPMIATREEWVRPEDTAETLGKRLAVRAADLVSEALPQFAAGELCPMPQPHEGASLTRPLTKADGWLDWNRPAVELERLVRAMWPWPRAWTTVDDSVLQIHRVRVVANAAASPGRVEVNRAEPIVACGRGGLALVTVQPAGGRTMPGSAFAAGRRTLPKRLGEFGAPPPQPPLIVPL